jgi:hypothetical protein
MDPKKDLFKGFKELKKIAAEKLVRILSNKLFVDIRKVRRFRIWQSEYLAHVMEGISQLKLEKQSKLKTRYIQFFIFILQKHQRKALLSWHHSTRALKLQTFPSSRMLSGVKLASFIIQKQGQDLGFKNFSLAFIKSNSWRVGKVRLALFTWKRWVVSELLAESHREMAGIRIVHFLHKKTAPLASFALRKSFFRTEKKVAICSLAVLVKRLVLNRKSFGFMMMVKKKNGVTPVGRGLRDYRFKFTALKRFAGVKKMIQIVNNKKREKEVFLELVKSFLKWKMLKKTKKRLFKRPKTTNRRIKMMGLKFLMTKARSLASGRLSSSFSQWKNMKKQKKVFEIDKLLIFNQAQVSAHIECQIMRKEGELKKIKRATLISNLLLSFLKRMKKIFDLWAEVLIIDDSRTNDRDIVYEYIRFLEDNLGVPHRFRN